MSSSSSSSSSSSISKSKELFRQYLKTHSADTSTDIDTPTDLKWIVWKEGWRHEPDNSDEVSSHPVVATTATGNEMDEEVTMIYGQVSLSPTHSVEENLGTCADSDVTTNVNTETADISALNHKQDEDNDMFCEGVKTPISIDAEPGGDVCNSSEDIDDKQSNSNIHVPSSFKNQTLIKVPLVAIHNSKPGASLSQDISPTTRRATTWQPRRYNKALLQQSTLWSSPPVKNTSSSPHTHSVDMHDKVPSSSTSPSSPSSSSGPKKHVIKTVSERLMRPTAADRSRNWNNPRNQLHRYDSSSSGSSSTRRNRNNNNSNNNSMHMLNLNSSNRIDSPMSFDEDLGGIPSNLPFSFHKYHQSIPIQQQRVAIHNRDSVMSFDGDSGEYPIMLSSQTREQFSIQGQGQRKDTPHTIIDPSKKELINRLTTPTKAFEHSKYKPVNDISRTGNQWKFKKALEQPKPLSSRLMKPTLADVHRRWYIYTLTLFLSLSLTLTHT